MALLNAAKSIFDVDQSISNVSGFVEYLPGLAFPVTRAFDLLRYGVL